MNQNNNSSHNISYCEDWYTANNGFVSSFQPYQSKLDSKQNKNSLTTYVFVHLSKSAGTSIKRALKNHSIRQHYTLYRRTWSNFKMLSQKYGPSYWMGKIISGTNSFGACDYAMHQHGCIYFTVLRDPVDRIISMYEYFCVDGREDHKYWLEGWTSCNHSIFEFAQLNYNKLIAEIGINQDPIVPYDNQDNITALRFPFNKFLNQSFRNINSVTNNFSNSTHIVAKHICEKKSLIIPFYDGIFSADLHIQSSINNLLHSILVIPFDRIDEFINVHGLRYIIHDRISDLHRNVNTLNHTLFNSTEKNRIRDILWPDMIVYNTIMSKLLNNNSNLGLSDKNQSSHFYYDQKFTTDKINQQNISRSKINQQINNNTHQIITNKQYHYGNETQQNITRIYQPFPQNTRKHHEVVGVSIIIMISYVSICLIILKIIQRCYAYYKNIYDKKSMMIKFHTSK